MKGKDLGTDPLFLERNSGDGFLSFLAIENVRQVNDVMSSGAAFFQLGVEEKMKWAQGNGTSGYLKNDTDR